MSISIQAIRALSTDMIDLANSGHPGMPLGAAPMAYALFTDHLRVNPNVPLWFNRDRLVLSAGHASAMLYSLLHLSGFDITMDDLKTFRKLNSKLPGHPEFLHTAGVDATTGPLGQGMGMAVGIAMAESFLGAKINRDDKPLVDHFTYVICGDGDIQEGVSSEAASMAANMKLGKLIVLYDANEITLDGPLSNSMSEDVLARYSAYGWHTQEVLDGQDYYAISRAIELAKQTSDQPSFIKVNTVIGCGSDKQGTCAVHGSPLGEIDSQIAKHRWGWHYEPFTIPKVVYDDFNTNVTLRGETAYMEWLDVVNHYDVSYPEIKSLLRSSIYFNKKYTFEDIFTLFEDGKDLSTRSASNVAINQISAKLESFIGGSADLSKSCLTTINSDSAFGYKNYDQRNINFGVREFAMACAINGMALHGGVRSFGATFFVFSDYLKAAIRLAAIMKINPIYVFTHDSIAVGEDGATHEPIEQLAMLRAMPNVKVLRPADANETLFAWYEALNNENGPTCIILSRQNLPILENANLSGFSRGGYIIGQEEYKLDATILATGSEVALALETKKFLYDEGIDVRVVNIPSFDMFNEQSDEYKKQIIGDTKNIVSVEMASSFGWHQYVKDGTVIGIDTYGLSGPGNEVICHFGFTTARVAEEVKMLIARNNKV